MILHNIFPSLCVERILLDDHSLKCAQCGRYIGSVYEERVYLLNGFKSHEEKIRGSRAFEEYTQNRNMLAETRNAEWRSFLRDLKFDEDEILPLETNDEWLPEDREWGNTAGC